MRGPHYMDLGSPRKQLGPFPREQLDAHILIAKTQWQIYYIHMLEVQAQLPGRKDVGGC